MMNNKNASKIDILLNNLERDLLTKEQVINSGKRAFAKVENKLLVQSGMEGSGLKLGQSNGFANWFAKYKYVSLATLSMAVMFGGYLVYQGFSKPEEKDSIDVVTKMATRYQEVTNGISIQDLQQYQMINRAAAVSESGQKSNTVGSTSLTGNPQSTTSVGAEAKTVNKDYKKAIDNLIKNSNISRESANILKAEVIINQDFSDPTILEQQTFGFRGNSDKFTIISVNSYDTYIDFTEDSEGYMNLYVSDPSQSVEYLGGKYSIKNVYQLESTIDCTNAELVSASPEDPEQESDAVIDSCVDVVDYINSYELKSFEATILESLLFDTNVKELGLVQNGQYYAFEQYMDYSNEDGKTIYNTYKYYFNPDTFVLNRIEMVINDELFSTINVIESRVIDQKGLQAIKAETLEKISDIPQIVEDNYFDESSEYPDMNDLDYKDYADRFNFYTFNGDDDSIANIYDASFYEEYNNSRYELRNSTDFDPYYVPYVETDSYLSANLSYSIGDTSVSIWKDTAMSTIVNQQMQWTSTDAEITKRDIQITINGTTLNGGISKIVSLYEYYDENNKLATYTDISYYLVFNYQGDTYMFSEYDTSLYSAEFIDDESYYEPVLNIKPIFELSTVEIFLAK
jgi:hypothetical protein